MLRLAVEFVAVVSGPEPSFPFPRRRSGPSGARRQAQLLEDAKLVGDVVEMEDGAGHREHIAHGDGHVDPAEGPVNVEIVGAVLEGSGLVSADLRPDTRRPLQARFQVNELEQGWREVEAYQELQEEGATHADDLRKGVTF
jgi:hypothetical protein